MSITEDIIAAAKSKQVTADSREDKVLKFPWDEENIPYRAFSAPTTDPLLRLRIYAKQMLLMPRYDLLYDVAHTGLADFVGLIYPHMQIKMFGRNLNPLINGLFTNSVEWVREYHPPFWEFAKGEDDGTLPCIEEIIIERAPIDPEAEIKARGNSAS